MPSQGPVSEECLFRSASVPLLLLAGVSTKSTIFLSPIVFGLAHAHHFYEFRISRGDKILMCTDGLSNMVEDEVMFGIVKGSRDIIEAVHMLIDRANANGGRDNIGVVMAAEENFAGSRGMMHDSANRGCNGQSKLSRPYRLEEKKKALQMNSEKS